MTRQPTEFQIACGKFAWFEKSGHKTVTNVELGTVVRCLRLKCTEAKLRTMITHVGGTMSHLRVPGLLHHHHHHGHQEARKPHEGHTSSRSTHRRHLQNPARFRVQLFPEPQLPAMNCAWSSSGDAMQRAVSMHGIVCTSNSAHQVGKVLCQCAVQSWTRLLAHVVSSKSPSPLLSRVDSLLLLAVCPFSVESRRSLVFPRSCPI